MHSLTAPEQLQQRAGLLSAQQLVNRLILQSKAAAHPDKCIARPFPFADVVSVVVTEMGAVPPSSVAVILREAQRDASSGAL